jgi:hypothetical protein
VWKKIRLMPAVKAQLPWFLSAQGSHSNPPAAVNDSAATTGLPMTWAIETASKTL